MAEAKNERTTNDTTFFVSLLLVSDNGAQPDQKKKTCEHKT